MILCFLLLFAFIVDIGGVRTFVENSNFFSRFFESSGDDIAESGRLERKLYFLKHAWEYPFGGLHMQEEIGYAHDLLLDAYDEFGFLSLFLLIAILYDGLKKLLFVCKNKSIDLFIRLSFLCVYIAILLEFCVEPIIAGMQWFFICYCLINGCLAAMHKKTLEVDF